MDQADSDWQIGTLTAIVRMLVVEHYGPLGDSGAPDALRALAHEGDPLACAIVNVLGESEIDQAFATPGRPHATHEEALRALPVWPYLTSEQRERARLLRVAEDAVDRACAAGAEEPERVALEALLDDLAEHRGDVPTRCGSVDALGDALPEPWRTYARMAVGCVREMTG